MASKYPRKTSLLVFLFLTLLGSFLISVDGQAQLNNVLPRVQIASSPDIVVNTTSDLVDFEEA